MSHGVKDLVFQSAEFEVHLILELHLHVIARQIDIVCCDLIELSELLFKPLLLVLLALLLHLHRGVHRNLVIVVHVVHEGHVGLYLLLGLVCAELDDV